MVINIEALLPFGWGQPAPSSLTTFDEVGNVDPSPPLFFPGETEIKLWGLGLVNYLQGHSCRNVPHSAQGEDAVKKIPMFPLVTVLSPPSAKSALPWGWACTPPGRGAKCWLQLHFLFAFIPVTANISVPYNCASNFTHIPYISLRIFFSLKGGKKF